MSLQDTDPATTDAASTVHPDTSSDAGEESHDMYATAADDHCDGGTDLYDVDEEYTDYAHDRSLLGRGSPRH